jgi:hypothetical protein
MTLKSKRILLAIVFVITLIAAYLAPKREEKIALPAKRSTASADFVVQETEISKKESVQKSNFNEILKLKNRNRLDIMEGSSSFLAAKQWSPPPARIVPVVTQPVPVQIPQAPVLPFQVIGQLIEDGKVSIFLKYNAQNLVVHVGDTIADTYKVEGLNGSILTLLYLPLNQRQTLELRNIN